MTQLKVRESDREGDKGRAVTDSNLRESDGAEELSIRRADFQVSNRSPLVIPSEVEGSAVRLARMQKSLGSSGGPAVSLLAVGNSGRFKKVKA